MRILFVITRGDTAGGAQMHVRDMASRLVADGHRVRVVTGATGALTDDLAALGIDHASCSGLLREVHPIHDVRAVKQLAGMIREFDPDVVTAHSSKAGMLARIAAKLAGTPCLFTVHGWAFIDTVPQPIRGAYQVMERLTAPLAHGVICVSEQVVGMGVDAGIDRSRFTVIHNGMKDVPAELRAVPHPGEPVKAVMVARFAAPKDHVSLLKAIALVPDLHLDLIGDGPDEAPMKALAAELGVTDRVRFLGRRSDVAEQLARAHVFVLSSKSEAFPYSTLEAMRAGLPVVVSDVGGAGEAVVDEVTGLLFPREDVSALADRLRRLSTDPELRRAMGAAGRERYEQHFTFDRMYEQTLSMYRSAADRKRRVVGDMDPIRQNA